MHIKICTSDTIFPIVHLRGSSYNLMYWRSMNGKIVAQGEQVLIDVTIPLNFFLLVFFTTLKGKGMCPSLLADPKTMNFDVSLGKCLNEIKVIREIHFLIGWIMRDFAIETWTMRDIKIYAHQNLHKRHHFSCRPFAWVLL